METRKINKNKKNKTNDKNGWVTVMTWQLSCCHYLRCSLICFRGNDNPLYLCFCFAAVKHLPTQSSGIPLPGIRISVEITIHFSLPSVRDYPLTIIINRASDFVPLSLRPSHAKLCLLYFQCSVQHRWLVHKIYAFTKTNQKLIFMLHADLHL